MSAPQSAETAAAKFSSWHLCEYRDAYGTLVFDIHDPAGVEVMQEAYILGATDEQSMQRARLIAAAPDLLEVCVAMVAMLEHSMENTRHPVHGRFVRGVTDLDIRPDGLLKLSHARAAIAKARATSVPA